MKKTIYTISRTKGHGTHPVDLSTSLLAVVNTHIGTAIVAWPHWNMAICAGQVIGLSPELSVNASSFTLAKEKLDHGTKGVNEMQVRTVVGNTRIIDTANREVIFISYAKPTTTNKPRKGKPTDPLESMLTCADIYSDRASQKNLKHRLTKTQLNPHVDQAEKFETHCQKNSHGGFT